MRNLEVALDAYRDKLGFNVPPGDVAVLPSGLAYQEIPFIGNYLEIRSIHDAEKVARFRPNYATFLPNHEGALMLVLNVTSASATASALRKQGFEVPNPEPAPFTVGGTAVPAFWYFELPRSVLGEPGVVFCEYAPAIEKRLRRTEPQEWQRHPNTARRIICVWIATSDIGTPSRVFEKMGFTGSRRRELPEVGAAGREIRIGEGSILLLQPKSARGRVAAFVDERGEGIMGVSVEAENLETARKVLEANTERSVAAYRGPYGVSILVPGTWAHGLWIELVQI